MCFGCRMMLGFPVLPTITKIMANKALDELRATRALKAEALSAQGFQVYPSTSQRSHLLGVLRADFERYEDHSVTVAGRLLSLRKQGAVTFMTIADDSGQMQLFVSRKALESGLSYPDLGLLDRGDFIESSGLLRKTKRAEISIFSTELRILAKSIRPLPDKHAGLKDRSQITRKRYLEVIQDAAARERFRKIAHIVSAIRGFLDARGFIEIPTPILQPQYGGGTAKPFVTHVQALDQSMYLSISHELYLKRLIIAGYERVYTIGRYFRNEGIDYSHHPEFMMVETMAAYQNYEFSMSLIEAMFKHIAATVFGKYTFQVGAHTVDFSTPWRRLSMVTAVSSAIGADFSQTNDLASANALLKEAHIAAAPSIGHALVALFEHLVEPTLIQPTLVFGHPVEISPLAKPLADDPRYAERFEIFIGGIECGDNWSEQNDPQKLLHTLKAMHSETLLAQGECHSLDYAFIEALEYGMPPTTGIGPGVERMAMIFLEQERIDDVIFFPIRRPHLHSE